MYRYANIEHIWELVHRIHQDTSVYNNVIYYQTVIFSVTCHKLII